MQAEITKTEAFECSGTIGSGTFTSRLTRLSMTCPDCYDDMSYEPWDMSDQGHDACGVKMMRLQCWDCGCNTSIWFENQCIIAMQSVSGIETLDAHGEAIRLMNPPLPEPYVGEKIYQSPVGSNWNVKEGRPYTWREMNQRTGNDDDEIPF